MLLIDPDIQLRNAAPLSHPDNYSVRVRDGLIPLYRDGMLTIDGRTWAVEHDPVKNGDMRGDILEACDADPTMRAEFLWAVSRPEVSSLIYWINTFVWTFVQQEIDETGHQKALVPGRLDPMVLWPCQDRFAAELFFAITKGYDWCVDKSRQMGATWLIASVFLWFCLYRPGVHFDVLSQTEEEVDNPEDPQSIFWKLDFIVQKLPEWLVPNIDRAFLRLANTDLKSTIMGRSTTSKKGRGGAKTGVLFDEAALNDKLESIWTGYGQSCASRGANSTPHGPGFFAELVQRNPNVHKIKLPWWEHPVKGRGRFIDWWENKRFMSSPFYIEECRRASPDKDKPYLARTTRAIAQELDLDHTGGGRTIYDSSTLTLQESLCPPFPTYRGNIIWTGVKGTRIPAIKRGEHDLTEFEAATDGKWDLWCELEEDENGLWRPNQRRNYAMGEDIAQGIGASESTISVFCVEEGRKVAEYRNANINPVQFAILCAMAGYWFGGERGGAMQAPEANGLGQTFIRTLVRLRYPWIFQERDDLKRGGLTSKVLGWNSNTKAKRSLFTQHNDAMGRGEYINPSPEALRQAGLIINYESGGCGPSVLAEQSEDARALHADLVTADALGWYAGSRIGFAKPRSQEPRRGTAAYRRLHPEIIRG